MQLPVDSLLLWCLVAPLLTTVLTTAVDPISLQSGCILQCHLNCSNIFNSSSSVSSCDCERKFVNESFNVCTRRVFECSTGCSSDDHTFIQLNNGNWFVPFQAVYHDAHQIKITIDLMPNASITVAEYRAAGSKDEWKYAGAQRMTNSIVFRLPNVCEKYELRLVTLFNNGTYIASQASRPGSPPDLIIDTLRLTHFYFDQSTGQIVANYSWNSPFEFDSDDILYYRAVASPVTCSLPAALSSVSPIVTKTDQGGTASLSLPKQAADLKCQYVVDISAMTVCSKNFIGTSTKFLQVDCMLITNYTCPFDEYRKPECAPWVTTQPIRVLNGSVDVQVSWPKPSKFGTPVYYHLRYGLAAKKHPFRPPLPFGHPRFPPPRADEPFPPFPDHRPLNFGLPFGGDRDKSAQKNDDDDGIWFIKGSETDEIRSDANSTIALIKDLRFDKDYGVQVCAIFTRENKVPHFERQLVHPFKCSCSSIQGDNSDCKASNSRCLLLNTIKTNSLPSAVSPVESSLFPTVITNVPSVIMSVRDFTQQLLGVETNGMRMRFAWQPPKDILTRLVSRYEVKMATVDNCTLDSTCCAFAKQPPLVPQPPNNPSLDFTIPSNVVAAKCRFLAEITMIAVNGASSVTFHNLVTPNQEAVLDVPIDEVAAYPYAMVPLCDDLYNCSHGCTNNECSCPPGMVLLSNGQTCESVCKAVHNCSYSCDPQGVCVCPAEMKLEFDQKTCVFTDPEPQIPLAKLLTLKITPVKPSSVCAAPSNLSITEFDTAVRLVSMNVSWAQLLASSAERFDSVTIQWYIQSDSVPWLGDMKCLRDCHNVTVPSIPSFIVLKDLWKNSSYVIRLCAHMISTGTDINVVAPFVLRSANPVISEAPSYESDGNLKMVIMAILIPVCSIVIFVSVGILLCHFHPEWSHWWGTVLRRQKIPQSMVMECRLASRFTRPNRTFPQWPQSGDQRERVEVPVELPTVDDRPKVVRSISDHLALNQPSHENEISSPSAPVLIRDSRE